MRGRDGGPYRRRRRELKALRLPCWLCGRDIDYELGYTDPWSFTVDHVIPLSKGGDPLDWGNLRAAHYRCNQRKGDQLVPIKHDVESFSTSRAW